MLKITKIIYTLTFLILLISCSDKKNIVNNDIDVFPEITTVNYNFFELNFSYEDSTNFYWYNQTSSLGNFRNNTSICLIKFSNLPNENIEVIENPKLTIVKDRTFPVTLSNLNIKVGILKEDWINTEASWYNTTKDSEWNEDWFNYGNIDLIKEVSLDFSKSDTLNLELDWNKIEPLFDNFKTNGIALVPKFDNPNKLLQYHSIFSTLPPKMSFIYIRDNDTTHYERTFHRNRFITSKIPDDKPEENSVKISNIIPNRTYLKFDIHEEVFDLPANFDLTKLTINKAELVLFAKNKNKHFLGGNNYDISIVPQILRDKLDINELPLNNDNLESIIPVFPSFYYFGQDSLKINITSVFQAFLSEQRENNGIVLQSTSENRDFSFVEFFSFDDSVEEKKKPYIRVIYTKPPDF